MPATLAPPTPRAQAAPRTAARRARPADRAAGSGASSRAWRSDPSGSGVAAGSYARSTVLYSEQRDGEPLCELKGQRGGVTHVAFRPDGKLLFTGGRKDGAILCWDLRYTDAPVAELARAAGTNQRIGFDVDPCGRYLATGGTDGFVRVYDLSTAGEVARIQAAGGEAVNGVGFHPYRALLCTASGQRHFECGPGGGGDSSSSDAEEGGEAAPPLNELAIWQVGGWA